MTQADKGLPAHAPDSHAPDSRAPDAGALSFRTSPAATAGLRPIAAFDFDGTLTVRDSFAAFLKWRTPARRWAPAAARLAPAATAYALTRDRGRMKAAVFAALVGPISAEALAAEAQAFADCDFDRLMRPDALACWAAHGVAGDLRVIVTASPEILVAPFARRLGADCLIGTRLTADALDRVNGALDGPNCRGPEKVTRLEAVFGPAMRLLAAYGDTAGDADMLARAERGRLRPFTGRPGRR